MFDNLPVLTDVTTFLKDSADRWIYQEDIGNVYINTIPKSGTLLLRNILMHVIGRKIEEQLVFYHNFREIMDQKSVCIGHVDGRSWIPNALRQEGCRVALLIREPAALLVAQARSLFDPRLQGAHHTALRRSVTIETALEMLIGGYSHGETVIAPYGETWAAFAGSWFEKDVVVMNYDDIVSDPVGQIRFLLNSVNIPEPRSIVERVVAGRNVAISATYLPPFSVAKTMQLRAKARRLIEERCPDVMEMYAQGRG